MHPGVDVAGAVGGAAQVDPGAGQLVPGDLGGQLVGGAGVLQHQPAIGGQVYLIGFQMATQVGAAVISPSAGLGHDRLGHAPTYLVRSALVATFTLVSVLTLRADAKGTHGLPAVGTAEERSPAAV